jgi:crotonobetainyl-CoA:carnitine CoA-transferase CaiB-like acyl-CoA transferase
MAEGLAGIQVLELGGGVSAPLAGKLMADLGATVVKLEPPEGDRSRRRGPFVDGRTDLEASGLFAFLNAGKRSVTADLTQAAGRATLDGLAANAHVLLHNFTPRAMQRLGIDAARLAAVNPRLVLLSMTPFGQTGPYKDWLAEDLNLIHAGGWGWLCPGPGTDPALPPIKPFGQHAMIQAAVHGAVSALGALFSALRTGRGEHIDCSAHEAVLTIVGRNFMNWSYAGQSDSRLSKRAYAPNGFFRCKDGDFYLVCIEEEQWQRLVELMGNPAWAQEPRFADKLIRAEHEPELNGLLQDWIGQWNAEELFKTCQERRICASKVFSFGELPAQEHLRSREFIREQPLTGDGTVPVPGPPYRLQRPWWDLRGPAPRLGEANATVQSVFVRDPAPTAKTNGKPLGRPLAGVRVLDFGWVWAGPHATLMLAHMGADVIKVESVSRMDLLRRSGSWAQGMERGPNRFGQFNQLAQGKRSVAVNLGSPEGLALARRLAAQADVVSSNFGTGVMERFGLGPADLHKIKPDLIVAAVSGYGQTGPYRNYIGYGQAAVPLSGISALTGYAAGRPSEVHIAYGDPTAGVYAAYAILAALVARERHGGGQYIDCSLWEVLAASGFEGWMHDALGKPPLVPMGNRDPYWAPHDVFRCAGEEAWVSIAVTDDAQWRALCGAMEQPALADDARFRTAEVRKANEPALNEIVAAWCAPLDKWEVTRRLQAVNVPAMPSLSHPELTSDPHFLARNYFSRIPHPEVGEKFHPGPPWRFAQRPNGATGPAPLLGQHTDAALHDWLGLSAGDIAALRQSKALE